MTFDVFMCLSSIYNTPTTLHIIHLFAHPGHLEQIYNFLRAFSWCEIDVLHSSIDVEDCLESMNSNKLNRRKKRKILLASAIADSSVTVPGVACVIDTCKALEMKWNRKVRVCIVFLCKFMVSVAWLLL